jgi:hypothetical protein
MHHPNLHYLGQLKRLVTKSSKLGWNPIKTSDIINGTFSFTVSFPSMHVDEHRACHWELIPLYVLSRSSLFLGTFHDRINLNALKTSFMFRVFTLLLN